MMRADEASGQYSGPVRRHDVLGGLIHDYEPVSRHKSALFAPYGPDDIADAVSYIVTRDRRVAVNELLVRAAEQDW
jgi:NADP-dependent 3-hydroxy acid dehydrogenase YdfG